MPLLQPGPHAVVLRRGKGVRQYDGWMSSDKRLLHGNAHDPLMPPYLLYQFLHVKMKGHFQCYTVSGLTHHIIQRQFKRRQPCGRILQATNQLFFKTVILFEGGQQNMTLPQLIRRQFIMLLQFRFYQGQPFSYWLRRPNDDAVIIHLMPGLNGLLHVVVPV